MPTLLVVDDEATICYAFTKLFADEITTVLTAASLATAREIAATHPIDVFVLDLQLPDGSGFELFEEIRKRDSKRPVIFLTAQGTTDTAIEAMKRGAFDYLLKPIDLQKLSTLLPLAFEAARLMLVPAELPGENLPDRIIGRNKAMQELCKSIGRIAAQDVNVLILGESGTGKELVARAIYHHSGRANKPFLAINCAALPENLVESELFGHEQGAFTGAHRQRIGKFEQCDGGTILLDEIGDMPLPVQAKMLRLLQEQQFERLGGNQVISTRVRVLAATNQNLENLISQGKFRNDLYYRLKVVTLQVPPLRDRIEDIPELAYHFLFADARELNRDVRGFAPEVLDLLQSYSWPGNVRELQSAIKTATLNNMGQTIRAEALPQEIRDLQNNRREPTNESANRFDLIGRFESLVTSGGNEIYSKIIAEVDRQLVTLALHHTRGNQARASELLGINRTTLRTKLRELGITLDKVVADKPADE